MNKKNRKVIVLLGIIGLILLGALLWWKNGLTPANANNRSSKIFLVQKGSNIREIANNLKKEGLIKDPVVFFLLVKQLGIDNKIQAGDFRLSPSMNAQKIAESLTHGSLDVWITIPEGKRAEEIAEILEDTMPLYNESWRQTLIQYEGYLFPDTYLIPRDANIEYVVELLRNTFDLRFATVQNTTNLTQEQIVILASMIEREVKHQEDRPIVSSVIHNRLEIGIPLQIDATVQYALGYHAGGRTWWKKGLTRDDLQIDSLYNTYKYPGLPPGPISNPGLSVLQAAANPANTDYLFYITDRSGINRYTRTNEEHNANIKKYGL